MPVQLPTDMNSWRRFCIALLVLAYAFGAHGLDAATPLYTCGMHPQVIRNAPGECPICGMDLTPLQPGSAGGASQITIDPVTIQRMNLKTALVGSGPVRREVRAVGIVAIDESTRRDITTKYEGWLEQLHVTTTWANVRAGDPLFEIYAPDLYNAQLNYLVARRSEGEGGGPLTRASIERMRLFDLPQSFIDEVAATNTARRTFTFHAPSAGVVIEKMGVQGQMMRPGEVIYRLADLSRVWVVAQLYESDLPFVREGAEAEVQVTFGATRSFPSRVERLLPEVSATTRTIAARLVVENSEGILRPGMFAEVRFVTELKPEAVLVPDTAVLRSGEYNTVFIALADGRFEPREIELGARSTDQHYEVRSGLADGERVVVSGQFLLDSESRRREGMQKMLARQAEAATATPQATGVSLPAGVTVYTCPMDIHAHVVDDEPGRCGECGMTLVPTSTVDHGGKSEAIWLQQHGGHAH